MSQCHSSKGMQRGHCWCVDELGTPAPSGAKEDGTLPCDGEWQMDLPYCFKPGGRGEEEEQENRERGWPQHVLDTAWTRGLEGWAASSGNTLTHSHTLSHTHTHTHTRTHCPGPAAVKILPVWMLVGCSSVELLQPSTPTSSVSPRSILSFLVLGFCYVLSFYFWIADTACVCLISVGWNTVSRWCDSNVSSLSSLPVSPKIPWLQHTEPTRHFFPISLFFESVYPSSPFESYCIW